VAGFTSYDNFIQQSTVNGKTYRQDWNKNYLPTAAGVQGEWMALHAGSGNPGAATNFSTGTNLSFQQLSDQSQAFSMSHGGNVGPDYKFLMNASSYCGTANSVPAVAMLVDMLGFYRVNTVTTTTPQTLVNPLSAFSNFTANPGTGVLTHTNLNLIKYTRVQLTTTVTLPAGLALSTDYYVIKLTDLTCQLAISYANAVAGTFITLTDAGTGTHTLNTLYQRYTSGVGLKHFMWNTTTTALGSAAPNLSVGYTNEQQLAGRSTPSILPIGKSGAVNGHIMYSGAGTGKYGPFVPFQAGDSGTAKLDSVTISTSYITGEFSIGVCKPLITLPMTTTGIAAEREFLSQIPGGLPRIYDGAALYWLLFNGSTTPQNAAFYGHCDFSWG
jgi:hypothetical protein